jgi:hypothetical protein
MVLFGDEKAIGMAVFFRLPSYVVATENCQPIIHNTMEEFSFPSLLDFTMFGNKDDFEKYRLVVRM